MKRPRYSQDQRLHTLRNSSWIGELDRGTGILRETLSADSDETGQLGTGGEQELRPKTFKCIPTTQMTTTTVFLRYTKRALVPDVTHKQEFFNPARALLVCQKRALAQDVT
mgnify:CR=1 FL=1